MITGSSEWEELRGWVKTKQSSFQDKGIADVLGDMYNKMVEIEKRTLPERVASLCESVNDQALWDAWQAWAERVRFDWSQERYQREKIAKALRTGDTSELEKWGKK